MRDAGFFGFLGGLLLLGLKRPFLFICAYIYVDIVSPQRISYGIFSSLPVSFVVFGLAVAGWLITDKKGDMRVAPRQILLFLLLCYCGLTTYYLAEFTEDALEKWDWVWKSMLFAIFLPLTLRTKLRIETTILFMVLSLSAITIGAGIKTVLGGSGYGSFAMMVDNNSGIYEDSILSTAAIMAIPLILFLMRHGTIFPRSRWVTLFGAGLIFACLLTPVGTQARTGLLCAGFLAVLTLRDVKRRGMYVAGAAVLGLIALPLLPATFSQRMGTISNYQADQSASTRLAVWRWTFEFAQDHPLGGGFDSYRGNSINYYTSSKQADGEAVQTVDRRLVTDEGRAFHSSYFELLGEQGWFGLGLWLVIHFIGIVRMEWLRRHYRGDKAPDGYGWVSPLATSLQHAHLVFLLGAAFVGIGYQPIFLMLLSLQIGLDTYLARRRKQAAARPLVERMNKSGLAA